jgi:hydrogenase nickel incorporation protein HypB
MCITCGCSVAGVPFRELKLGMAPLPDVPEFSLENAALRAPGRDAQTLHLETQILGKNQRIAQRNRSRLTRDHILALNLVSSPGAGKTTLLERTLTDLKDDLNIAVIEGDQATSNDAERIRATGVKAVQINTGTGCHLEADMVERALDALKPAPDSLLMIENVGNLVCPALFDLGENAKVVIFSVTEGEDKPLKYPHMFNAASVLLLSKVDLLSYLRFDMERAVANALAVNPRLRVVRVSAYTGQGLAEWYAWLKLELSALRSSPT